MNFLNLLGICGMLEESKLVKQFGWALTQYQSTPVDCNSGQCTATGSSPALNLGFQTLPAVTALTAQIFSCVFILPNRAFSISFRSLLSSQLLPTATGFHAKF